jgi:ribonuclease Z
MCFVITVLGSSSALPTSSRFPTAQVLNVHERFFLIDCGEGTQMQLRKFSFNLSRIHHIFLSHLHGDHFFGLFGLLSSWHLMGRTQDLHIFAHYQFSETLDYFLKNVGQGLTYQIVHHPFHSTNFERIYEDKHIQVDIIPLRHSIPTVGFVFRETPRPLNIKKEAIDQYNLSIRDIRSIKAGNDFLATDGQVVPNTVLTLAPFKLRSYAFCTDTKAFNKLGELLGDIDTLYFEATYSEKDKTLARKTGHSTAGQAAQIAKQAGVKRLLIGHYSSRYKSTVPLLQEARYIFPETYAVEDGEKYHIMPRRDE